MKPAARTPLTSADGKPRVVNGNETSGNRGTGPLARGQAGRPRWPKPKESKGLGARGQRSFSTLLAGRAVVGRALSLHQAPNGRAAAAAGLASAVVDAQLLAVGPRLVPERAIAAEGGAHPVDRLPEHGGGLAGNRAPLGCGQTRRATTRIHERSMKDLARVDVPDAGDSLLIEKEHLDGRSC